MQVQIEGRNDNILMLIKYIKRLDGAADHDANIIIDTACWL